MLGASSLGVDKETDAASLLSRNLVYSKTTYSDLRKPAVWLTRIMHLLTI